MKAIVETGNTLSVAFDTNDSVGIIDSFAPRSEFFSEFEIFLDHVRRCQRSDISSLDYMSVCSPNYLHFPHITASLGLGCNVICEKPLVPTLDLLNDLKTLEVETGKSVYTILQLRHHPAVIELKKKVSTSKSKTKSDVELTYVTSRGSWYSKSWKKDDDKSFGVVTNIGIHFFDMLHYVFGGSQESILFLKADNKASGFIEFEHARVRWFLSIDPSDLPKDLPNGQTTFRNIEILGENWEFSSGFNDLHTTSYSEIVSGRGFGLDEVMTCVGISEISETHNLQESVQI